MAAEILIDTNVLVYAYRPRGADSSGIRAGGVVVPRHTRGIATQRHSAADCRNASSAVCVQAPS